jgi:hypothetical protein
MVWMFCFAVHSARWKPQHWPPHRKETFQKRRRLMMHGSARFASWRSGELYSYLVVTLSLVWNVRHHCQHVLCAGSHSLVLSGHSSHEKLRQECSASLDRIVFECPWDVGGLQCCQHDLALLSEQQLLPGSLCSTFQSLISPGHSNQSSTTFAIVQGHQVFYIRMNVL